MLSMFKPKIFETIKTYNKNRFVSDFISGITVAIIALPLSIAFAIASKMPPNVGIYTAIISGIVMSLFSGASILVYGPLAAFIAIVSSIISNHNVDILNLTMIVTGIIIILFSIFKVHLILMKIPTCISAGFSSGIALTIFTGQLKNFFGLTYETNANTCFENVFLAINNMNTINFIALLLGILALLSLLILPSKIKIIPESFLVLLVFSIIVKIFNIDVFKIADLYELSNTNFSFKIPDFSLLNNKYIYIYAIQLATFISINTSVALKVSENLTNEKSSFQTELIAQGIGNIILSFFGCIPASSDITRIVFNAKNGGKTPISCIAHSIILLIILLGFIKYVGLIPMPIIASLLFTVANRIFKYDEIKKYIVNKQYKDLFVFILFITITFFINLSYAVYISIFIYLIITFVNFILKRNKNN